MFPEKMTRPLLIYLVVLVTIRLIPAQKSSRISYSAQDISADVAADSSSNESLDLLRSGYVQVERTVRDTTWMTKYCPREMTAYYVKICQMHCWWNGWEGGFCTNHDVCICNTTRIELEQTNNAKNKARKTEQSHDDRIHINVIHKKLRPVERHQFRE